MEEIIKKNIEELKKVYDEYEELNRRLRKAGEKPIYDYKQLRIGDDIAVLNDLLEGNRVAESWEDTLEEDKREVERLER